MLYEVRHVPPGAVRVQQDRIEADSELALRTQLAGAGSTVLSLAAAQGSRMPVVRPRQGLDVSWWCRELSTLLRAGMTVVEALETLAADSQDPVRARLHTRLQLALREGQSLSKAMRSVDAFPSVLLAGVAASERTSTLVDALQDYLVYSESMERLRRQVVSASIYPAVVVSLGAAISLFLLLYVIPRFGQMYHDLRGDPSGITVVVLWLSRTVREHSPLIVTGVGLVAATCIWAWRSGLLVRWGQEFIEVVPPLRAQWDQFRLAKLYQSLSLMVRGGYPLDEAMQVCEGLDLGERMARGLALARQEIARGRSASTALSAAGLTETVTQRLLAVGERTGSFDTVLKTIAERHAQAFATFVERATRIAEPLLLLLVALAVGGIVVMMYVPVFDIAGGLRR